MTLLKIAQIGHPILRTLAEPVSREELASKELQTFIDDLIETMRDANGAGLAATQVHVSKQILAIEVKDNPRYPYKPNIPLTIVVNPILEPIGEERFDNYEGCLSVPNLRGLVSRHAQAKIRGLDRHGNPFEKIAKGLTAGTFQHEIDHLHGTLFIDRVTNPKSLCTWTEFDRFHKQAFVERIIPFVERMGG